MRNVIAQVDNGSSFENDVARLISIHRVVFQIIFLVIYFSSMFCQIFSPPPDAHSNQLSSTLTYLHIRHVRSVFQKA